MPARGLGLEILGYMRRTKRPQQSHFTLGALRTKDQGLKTVKIKCQLTECTALGILTYPLL